MEGVISLKIKDLRINALKEKNNKLKEENRQLREEVTRLKTVEEKLNEKEKILDKTKDTYEKLISDVKGCKDEYNRLMEKMRDYQSKMKYQYKEAKKL